MKKLLRQIPLVGDLAVKARSVKRSIIDRKRLQTYVRQAPELKIVIGAGNLHDKSWCPTEVDYLNLLERDQWLGYFSERKIDCILAEHVWEHLTQEQGAAAARNCFEFLKPGGYLRVAVPDGNHPDPQYIEKVKPGGTGPGAHDHKMLYTHKTFGGLFEGVGFQVRLLEYFDDEGNFQANDWNTDQGTINRSQRVDPRNQNGKLVYTSVIVDAVKPE
ncbi:MAG: methyltransferase domain-containing protein [Planctomycetota bacterium]